MVTGSTSFSLRNGKELHASNNVGMRSWPAPGRRGLPQQIEMKVAVVSGRRLDCWTASADPEN
jgi:hypothetical protein